MTGIWVDTDFGFDDLWALLLLRHLDVPVAGVSLVAGNAPLEQVMANAMGAKAAYGFAWDLWQGASRPLKREPETAERVLGPTGMQSRGRRLPDCRSGVVSAGAVDALRYWLQGDSPERHEILALGPLTNIALLLQASPELADRISRLVWMGGSAGAGNHTPAAEFNAVADAEALACVADADLPLDIVDLEFCRAVTFEEKDMPECDPLTGDLLGGYLDIALERGRAGMAIYDPLAALAMASPHRVAFAPCALSVSTVADESYGNTGFSSIDASKIRLATEPAPDLAQICLDALKKEGTDGPGQ